VLDRDSSDPYRLDGNGDGFACGSRPEPSSAQIAVYVAAALLAALVIGLAVLYWQRRSRRRQMQRASVEKKLDTLQVHLRSVQDSLKKIGEQIDPDEATPEWVQINASEATELSKLTAEEVEAVKSALRAELGVFDKSTLRVTIISSLATSVFGVATSIFINLYVP